MPSSLPSTSGINSVNQNKESVWKLSYFPQAREESVKYVFLCLGCLPRTANSKQPAPYTDFLNVTSFQDQNFTPKICMIPLTNTSFHYIFPKPKWPYTLLPPFITQMYFLFLKFTSIYLNLLTNIISKCQQQENLPTKFKNLHKRCIHGL